MEVYGERYGDVNQNCLCREGDKISTLPKECYSPPGDNCEWYRNCLHKYQDCRNTDSNYAIDYGYYFCKAYDKSYYKFSLYGRRWVDATRKCLQVALVPTLRLNNKPSCLEIEERAFASHTYCYVGGSACAKQGTPSVCSLHISNWLEIIKTIKDSFNPFSEHGDVCKTMEGLVSTMAQCPDQYAQHFLTWLDVALFSRLSTRVNWSILIPKIMKFFMKRLPVILAANIAYKPVCYALKYIGDRFNREKREVDTHSQDGARFQILLWETPGTISNHLKEAVSNFLLAIERGTINFEEGDELKGIVQINSAAECKDSECNIKYRSVIAPVRPRSRGETLRTSYGLFFIMTLFTIMVN